MINLQLKTFLLLLLQWVTFSVLAQPEACGEIPTMANNCADACVICDINGYTGTNDLQADGQDLGFIFCSNANDMHFIAFIAGSTSLSIRIDVSNCSAGELNFRSLDLGFYQSLDCQTFTPITECKEDLGNGDFYIFNTTTPLSIGQHYYLIMDGSAGSICDWTFTVLEGTTEANPLEESGEIQGVITTCPEQMEQFTVDFPVGATEFEWTVNGSSLNTNTPTIDYEFPNVGTYQLCVTSKNVCDEAPPSCQQIVVGSPSFTEINDVFCENDSYLVGGDTIWETGTYEFILQNQEGCDSLIIATLEELFTPSLSIEASICEGDTLFIGTSPFTQTGNFQESLLSEQECDSIVYLDLFVIICTIESNDIPIPTICHGTDSGQILFNVDNGTPPFTYTWKNLENTYHGDGNIASLGEMITIDSIPKGTYLITIEDGFGNSDIIISEVTEPPLITLNFQASDYQGVNVTCANGMDGTLSMSAEGGVPPYTYLWSSGETTATADELSATQHTVTVTDASGCEHIGSYTLTAPDSLRLSATFTNASCDGLSTGFVSIEQTNGGVPPYAYSLNGGTHQTNLIFENLMADTYIVEVLDANGCTYQVEGSLNAPQIPIVNLGDTYVVDLGEVFTWSPSINNINIQSLQWTGTDSLSCEDCLKPSMIAAISGHYHLEVTSEDGCVGSDSIDIEVIKVRKVYLPNAFSPDDDGINDYFTVFGAVPNVQMIEELLVFDRWGGLLFQGKSFIPNKPNLGWDGTAGGKEIPSGVYPFLAKVRFLDGEILLYEGDISLVR